MAGRNFTVTVKEREADQPCFLMFEVTEDIGLKDKSVVLHLREGTDIEDAKVVAHTLNRLIGKISIV